jgi:hypothetical protein
LIGCLKVLEELFEDDIFGSVDDDFADDDTFALEPTPLDTSRMKIVNWLPVNLYNAQDHHISIFGEMYSTDNNTEHGPMRFSSYRPLTVMPFDASDPSIFDASFASASAKWILLSSKAFQRDS